MKWPIVKLGGSRRGEWLWFPQGLPGRQRMNLIPFFKVGDMNLPENSREMTQWTNTVSANVLKSLKARAFPAGTVIFPKIGAAIATGKKRILTCDATFDNNVMGLVPTKLVEPRFLYYWSLTFDFTTISNIGPVPSVRKTTVESLEFPLPPLSEQRRIVEILDQAMPCERGAPRLLPRQWASCVRYSYIFGRPDEWTSSDNASPLANLVDIHSGGTPSKKNPDFWKGEIPWVSPKDMKQDILYDSADHISPFAAEYANLKYISPGAVLVVVRGMILAHTVPLALAGSRLTINQDMKALEPKSTDIDSIYLYAALRVSDRMILSKVRTAAHGTRKIDTEELLQLPILIPSRHDSDRFCRMMAQYNGTISRTVNTRGMIERLFENLLDHAFSGDLTAKWREGHMKELLAEAREQTKYLASHGAHNQRGMRFSRNLFSEPSSSNQ